MPQDPSHPGKDDGVQVFNSGEPFGHRAGLVIGKYLMIHEIGRGGMGTVYLAKHQELGRLVAVKFLARHLAYDKLYVELFLREAKAAAKLNHPGIVAVHDAGCLDPETYYFIMDYVEGQDLDLLLKERGKFPVSEALDYVRQAASALGYAHKHKIIHRDVKPENLMLTEAGSLKVCDLGLAKQLGESGALTQSGLFMGTPFYISPERLRDAAAIDSRADIYSLGASFFHLITGRIPYEGAPAVIMAMHLNGPLPEPRELDPSIDPEVSVIIRRMMAKEPAERYQTMESVIEALTESQTRMHSQTTALLKPFSRATAQVKRPAVPPRSNRWTIAAAVVVLLAAIVYGVIRSVPPPRGTDSKTPQSVLPPSAAAAKSGDAVVAERKIFDLDGSWHSPDDIRFVAWASGEPAPQAYCGAFADPRGGVGGSMGMRVIYDITASQSSAGVRLPLNAIDATPFKQLVFKVKARDPGALEMQVRLKDGEVVSEPLTVTAGDGADWKEIRIALKDFKGPPLNSLTEVDLVFADGSSFHGEPARAVFWVDDVELQ
ncbi:MAG: serine/threonine protein kinase [Verrucomicrobiae bacterium]|nr:serine/threonine protein kinase [Verrucomicrobiae bacterium]